MKLISVILISLLALQTSGCMTVAGLVTAPISSPASMTRQVSESGEIGLTIGIGLGLGLFLIPIAILGTTSDGFQKDMELLKYGTYTEPGTLRLRYVFDPWYNFPKGRDPVVVNYAYIDGAGRTEDDTPVDVWLIPMTEFRCDYIADLENTLSRELGLRVRATGIATNTRNMYDDNRWPKQLVAENVVEELKESLRRLKRQNRKVAYIILTNSHMNEKNNQNTFGFHFPSKGVSVISIAKIDRPTFANKDFSILNRLRLYKLVKQAVGVNYYGYNFSTDLKSVMFSPILTLDTLDSVNSQY